MKIRIWAPKHRSNAGGVSTRSYPLGFRPRHCNGLCIAHNHTGGSRPLPADPRKQAS